MITEIILIVGLLCGLLLATLAFADVLADMSIGNAGLFNLALAIFSVLYVVAFFIYAFSPKAIDVYRGDTTLKITYTDSIPTDTIVVWKQKN